MKDSVATTGVNPQRWVTALALELPEAVFKDVQERIYDLLAEVEELREWKRATLLIEAGEDE